MTNIVHRSSTHEKISYYIAHGLEKKKNIFDFLLREAAKKSIFFHGRAIKALTPPPLELNGRLKKYLV